jgi:pilus assembly protein CpaB
MKQKLVPIVSILVGLLAFILTLQYLHAKHQEFEALKRKVYEGARQVEVVAAAKDIPAGTLITEKDLAKRRMYEKDVLVRGHIVKADEYTMLIGRRTLFKLGKHEAIFWSDIEGGASAGGLAGLVKPGLRAISLPVGSAEAVSSMVQPLDRVDVLGTFRFPSKANPEEMETVTLTVLQDVSILATGQTLANEMFDSATRRARKTSYNTVTLEVTPREAELLVFAQQMKGRLTLSLRNPSDMSFEKDLPEIDFKHLENKLPELNLYRQRNIRHKRDI